MTSDVLVAALLPFFAMAFAVTVSVTPLAMWLARRLDVMDHPDQVLKPHARPIPYLGGAAICTGWVAAVALAALRGGVAPQTLLPMMAGGIAIAGLGLTDDVRHIPPKIRLLGVAAITLVVMIATGAGAGLVDAVASPLGVPLAPEVSVPLSLIVGVGLVLSTCNSTNLIDGLDGLCAGVKAIVSLGFAGLAVQMAAPEVLTNTDKLRMVLSSAMAGAALGFLVWNFNPARIFMGDAGSLLLGFNSGMLILLFAEHGAIPPLLGALLMFALPAFDTALAVLRRWRSGKPIFEGDRSHFYDQLHQRGLSVRATVLVCYGFAAAYAALGLLVARLSPGPALAAFLAVTFVTALAAWASGLTHPERRG